MSQFQNGHALIIGIGNDLPITVNDANDINDVLVDSLKASYPKENVQVLTGKNATRTNIEKSLDQLIAKTKNVTGSTAILYYSGHGAQVAISNTQSQYYLIPNDVDFKNIDSFLPANVLTEKINQIDSDKLLVLLDCCHAEGQFVQDKSLGGDEEEEDEPSVGNINNHIVQQLNGGQGKVFIASCLNHEKSYIGVGDKNSLFTKHLISAMEGRSSEDYDCVHVVDIIQYLFRKVPSEAKRKLGREQTPILNFADKLDANFFICMNSHREEVTTSQAKGYNRPQDEVDTIATKIYNQTTNTATARDHGIALGENSGTVNITINHGNNSDSKPSNHKPKGEGNYFDQAKEYIFEGEIERAIDLLKDNLTDSKDKDDLYLISGRWTSINKRINDGLMSFSKAEPSLNQIKNSLVLSIEKFEKRN